MKLKESKVCLWCFVNYRPQTKLRERNLFTPVCDSVKFTGGVLVRGRLCSGESLSRRAPRYSGRAGGTHPTGMHSCCLCEWFVTGANSEISNLRPKKLIILAHIVQCQFSLHKILLKLVAECCWNVQRYLRT